MFALGIDLLMRRAVITQWDDREAAEWPPHPDRVFMALTAAWAESEGPPDANQMQALQWLESLGPPALAAPSATSRRTACTSYVPINNDKSPIGKNGPYGAMGSLPIGRNRQPRMFPAVVPDSPTMFLIWDAEIPANVRPGLESVCELVTYLGHSSSPVRVWIEDRPPPASLIPNNDQATCRLRSFDKGRLDYLVSRYQAGLRPQPTAWQGYAPPPRSNEDETFQGPYDPALIVLRQSGGRTFALESAGMIANAIRNTLMARCKVAPPEWLSGHAADGSPSRIRRLTYIPLGNVNHAHADGHLLGIALALPRDVPLAAIEALHRQLKNHGEPSERVGEETGYLRLWFRDAGSKAVAGELHLELDERRIGQRPATLHPNRWTRAACRWTSITPIELPQFPRRQVTAEAVVTKTCLDAGFPEPVAVRVGRGSFVSGVPHATSFKVEVKPGTPARLLMHADVEFSRPVGGPMVLGAGRFRGSGVMLPRDGEVR